MGYQDFISENEAMTFAGVSRTTLNRFVESGYLEIETDNDGLRLYCKKALHDLFGAKDETMVEIEEILSADDTPTMITHPIQEALAAAERPKTEAEIIQFPNVLASAEQTSTSTVSEQSNLAINIAPEASAEPIEQITPINDEAALRLKFLEHKVIKYQNLLSLQEKMLDARENEIQDLRKQRDWLQQRIEAQDEKASRDQLLLLSETQMVRHLIAYQERRRSPIMAALEWFGLRPTPAPQHTPTEPAQKTIEISPTADSVK